jgi:hypothetical protein
MTDPRRQSPPLATQIARQTRRRRARELTVMLLPAWLVSWGVTEALERARGWPHERAFWISVIPGVLVALGALIARRQR